MYRSVVVIGAGASGLFAAKTLVNRFPDVLILEAQDHTGGRINQVHGLVPWPVQIGPEFVHGAKSVLVDVLKEGGFNLEEKAWPDYWYLPPVGASPLLQEGRQLVRDEEADDEIQEMHSIIDHRGSEKHPPPGRDLNAIDWLKSKGASDRMISAAEACYANDNASSLKELGLTEMIEENRRWHYGDTYLLTDRCLSNFVNHLREGVEIKTSSPVACIETLDQNKRAAQEGDGNRTKGKVLITCKDGSKVYCDHVIVTVSLKVLQKNLIEFRPPLPQDKTEAIQRLKMGNAIKIFLTFNERFWPKDMYDVLSPGCLVPEIWMLSYPPAKASDKNNKVTDKMGRYLITGFIAGEQADEMSKHMSEEQAVKGFLAQLDAMFATMKPTPSSSSSSSSNTSRGGGVASQSVISSFVYDWSKVPYVGGAYTSPALGARLGDRDKLAKPVGDAIFFAGEAAHNGMNMCIHGAMEAGQRAATQIISLYNQGKSKL